MFKMKIFRKIFSFLESSNGELSSKRLMAVGSCTALIYSFLESMEKLIASSNASDAIELFKYFMIFVAICCGFVTVEVLTKAAETITALTSKKKSRNGRRNNITN